MHKPRPIYPAWPHPCLGLGAGGPGLDSQIHQVHAVWPRACHSLLWASASSAVKPRTAQCVAQRLARSRCPEHLGRGKAEPALHALPFPAPRVTAAGSTWGPGRTPRQAATCGPWLRRAPCSPGREAGRRPGCGAGVCSVAGQLWRTCRDSARACGGAKERSGRTPTCQGSPSGSVGWSQHPVPRGSWPCVAGHSPPLVGVAGEGAPGGDRVK